MGKDFIFYPGYTDNVLIFDINTGEQIQFEKKGEWKCESLEFIKDEKEYYLQLNFILKNEKGNMIKVKVEDMKTSFTEKTKYLYQLEEQKLAIAERERRKNEEIRKNQLIKQQRETEILKKYGNYFGKLINNKQVVLGMNREMCKLSWGTPRDINTTIVSGLVHEQWVYSLKVYLYFENDKLTGIQL